MMGLLLQLFWAFFVIGLFTFGGGYAIISIIQSQIVDGKGWITESAFTDITAISQMTPGPVGLNCSTYVGYEVMKQAGAGELVASIGSFTASLAIVLPSFLIMLAIVKFYSKFHETPLFQGVLSSLKPVVAGMIAAAALALTVDIRLSGIALPFESLHTDIITANFPDWKSWALAAAAFVAYTIFKTGPFAILGAGAALGFLLYYFQ